MSVVPVVAIFSSSAAAPRRPKHDSNWYSMIKRPKASHGVSWIRICLLGEGGFGSVFFAKTRSTIDQETQFPSKMAVKSAVMDQLSSLKHEKRVLCHLGPSPCVHILLLEYCCGLSLGRQIKLSGFGLAESDIKYYSRDIFRGLKHIHCGGYIHCDIKPDNILPVPGSGERK
uniref:Protein kinase domain-containing protein n=1 Tax=Manihot esculenta TaxID=3983 RepID=A0A2C9WM23_MANES